MTLRMFAATALGAALIVLMAFAAWTGLRRAAEGNFTPVAAYPGFRHLPGPGGASAGGAAMVGLDAAERPAPPSPAELCGLLWSAPGVPAEGPAGAAASSPPAS